MSQIEPNQALSRLKRGLQITGIVVAVLLIAGSVALLLGSLGYDGTDTAGRLDSLRALVHDESHLRADHARLEQEFHRATQAEAALEKRIPDGPHEADFLAQISSAASAVGLQITDYRPGVVSPGKAVSKLRVELSCEGDYRSLCAFLDRLQELPRYSTTAKLEIDPGTTADRHLAKLSLELYFFSDLHNLAAQ